MLSFSLNLSKQRIEQLQNASIRAEKAGDLRKVKRLLSLLMLAEGDSISKITKLLQISR